MIEDVDAQINQDALSALKQLLEIEPHLHSVLFSRPEHRRGATIACPPQTPCILFLDSLPRICYPHLISQRGGYAAKIRKTPNV